MRTTTGHRRTAAPQKDRKRNETVPTESQEQQQLFSWAAWQAGKYPELKLLYHTPNGGSRGKAEAGRFKVEGVKAGVPDICLPVARGNYHGLYIELKRLKGSKITPEQTAWIADLEAQGYRAVICKGWETASKEILRYLEQNGGDNNA